MFAIAALGLVLFVFACKDDTVTPESFSLTVKVVDTGGLPVPGLKLSLAADLPFYQDGLLAAEKAAVMIPFSLERNGYASVIIEDIAGDPVRTLIQKFEVAGQHRVVWDGRDDSGIHQKSGVYQAHLIVGSSPENMSLFDGMAPMYMGLLDPEQVDMGTTDADGKIEISDRRLFPALYQAADMPAIKEDGTTMGTIHFDGAMLFGFWNPDNDHYKVFHEIVNGPGTLHLVWNPSASFTRSSSNRPIPGSPMILEGGYAIGPVYPNPFN